MPPQASVTAAVSTDTVLRWKHTSGAAGYRIYRRRTDAADWGRAFDGLLLVSGLSPRVGEEQTRTFKGVRGDDWIFGVSALAADGRESPIASAVPGGAFEPLP